MSSYFAKIDCSSNDVIHVCVATQEWVDEWHKENGTEEFEYIETFPDINRRGAYASIGMKYDREEDKFVPKKLFPSWVYDENWRDFRPPIPKPADGKPYIWDETIKNWVEETQE